MRERAELTFTSQPILYSLGSVRQKHDSMSVMYDWLSLPNRHAYPGRDFLVSNTFINLAPQEVLASAR